MQVQIIWRTCGSFLNDYTYLHLRTSPKKLFQFVLYFTTCKILFSILIDSKSLQAGIQNNFPEPIKCFLKIFGKQWVSIIKNQAKSSKWSLWGTMISGMAIWITEMCLNPSSALELLGEHLKINRNGSTQI